MKILHDLHADLYFITAVNSMIVHKLEYIRVRLEYIHAQIRVPYTYLYIYLYIREYTHAYITLQCTHCMLTYLFIFITHICIHTKAVHIIYTFHTQKLQEVKLKLTNNQMKTKLRFRQMERTK